MSESCQEIQTRLCCPLPPQSHPVRMDVLVPGWVTGQLCPPWASVRLLMRHPQLCAIRVHKWCTRLWVFSGSQLVSSHSRIIVVDDFIVLCRLQAPGLLAVPYRSPLMGYICVRLLGFVSSERFDLLRFLGDGYLQIRPEQHCGFFFLIFQGQILIIQAAVSKYHYQAGYFSHMCVNKHQIPYTVLLFVAFGSFLIHIIVSQPVLQTSIRHSSQLPHVPPATFPKRRGTRRERSLPLSPPTNWRQNAFHFPQRSSISRASRQQKEAWSLSWNKNRRTDCKDTGCPFAHPCPSTPLQPPAGSDLKTSTSNLT